MIGRPPPPATPKSGRHCDRPCHPKWLVRFICLQVWSGHARRYAVRKLCSSVELLGTEVLYADLETSLKISGPCGAALVAVGVAVTVRAWLMSSASGTQIW